MYELQDGDELDARLIEGDEEQVEDLMNGDIE